MRIAELSVEILKLRSLIKNRDVTRLENISGKQRESLCRHSAAIEFSKAFRHFSRCDIKYLSHRISLLDKIEREKYKQTRQKA